MAKFTVALANGVKGYLMGAANVVPGVSGGTMAVLTGIYKELIDSINSLMVFSNWKAFFKGRFSEFWKGIHGSFLLALGVGIVLSIFTLAKLVTVCMNWYPVETWGFFFGMIAASAVVMLFDIKGWKALDAVWAVLGIGLGVGICLLSPTQTPDDLWFIGVCGAIAICTMILPGISGSFVLMLLCKYEYVMTAVSTLNWPVLIVFAIGCAVGILAFSKFLHWVLDKAEKQTMLVLIGFVVGSLIKVWPWNDLQALVRSWLLGTGESLDNASAHASALADSGTLDIFIAQNGIDYHVAGAIILAIAGIAVVALIQILSTRSR